MLRWGCGQDAHPLSFPPSPRRLPSAEVCSLQAMDWWAVASGMTFSESRWHCPSKFGLSQPHWEFRLKLLGMVGYFTIIMPGLIVRHCGIVKALLLKSFKPRQGQVWEHTLQGSTLPTLSNGSYDLGLLHRCFHAVWFPDCDSVWVSIDSLWLNPEKIKDSLMRKRHRKGRLWFAFELDSFLGVFCTSNNASPWGWHLMDPYLLDE